MSQYIKTLEKTYKSFRDVKYILYEVKDSPYLVISFAAYFPVKASYSYLTAFEDLHCNRLYILDNFGFENKGCWYLCENLNFDVEYSIIDLITHIQRICGVSNENVITIGSSKGGWCALYYALKYHFGYVVVGAPQIYLGSYLNDGIENKRNILIGMVGEITIEKVNMLDNLIQKCIVPNKNIHIYFHHGLGDWHLIFHFKKFLESASKYIPNIFSDIKLYQGHEQLMNYFPDFLHEKIKTIIEGNSKELMKKKVNYLDRINVLLDEIASKTILSIVGSLRIRVTIPIHLDNSQFAISLVDSNNKLIYESMFQKETIFEINGIDNTIVKEIKIILRNSIGEIFTKTKSIDWQT